MRIRRNLTALREFSLKEETIMQYFDFVAAINPIVLGILALVLACGMYDYWMQPK